MEVPDLISALGGPAKVGRALGITTQAVSNWSATNRVPAEREVALWRMATEAGLEWTPPGAEGLALVAKGRAA
jgi:hypothetical protein